MNCVLVTGAESSYFLMSCLLVHSLRRCAPQLKRYVLDFGLTDPQRKFLQTHCSVLKRPADLGPDLHPHIYKVAISSYLDSVDWDTLVWVDADAILVATDAQDRLMSLIAAMSENNAEVALSVDSFRTIAAVFARAAEPEIGIVVQPFSDAVSARGIGHLSPYYNTGVIVCRSREYLADWAALAREIPFHDFYDQNLFNLVLHDRKKAPLTLSTGTWNLHGALLAEAHLGSWGDRLAVMSSSERTVIVHPTLDGVHVLAGNGVKLGSEQVVGSLRVCQNPALRKIQDFVLKDFFAESLPLLRNAGLLVRTQ